MGRRQRAGKVGTLSKYPSEVQGLAQELNEIAAVRRRLLHDLRDACLADDRDLVVALARELTGLDE